MPTGKDGLGLVLSPGQALGLHGGHMLSVLLSPSPQSVCGSGSMEVQSDVFRSLWIDDGGRYTHVQP